ncbi:MAG: GC-type dockerin domain-anchored protein, partial [Planctomycetota bacterium]
SFTPIAQSERNKSIGDPRAIVWNSAGTLGYVAGMGSSNVIVIDAAGARAGLSDTINVGHGPTGLALDEARSQLYVMCKFDNAISVIDTTTELESAFVPFHDSTPSAIIQGRKFLYDTHLTSGLGQAACASCHVDARTDGLAWDLGDPSGEMKAFDQNCPDGGCEDWHPMKGPMTTQTMQDIIGLEPHHWRGDRFGIEEFNGAFLSINGDDQNLTDQEMQRFEDFLATIHFPPSPFRDLDNTLPDDLPLDGHYTVGRFGPAGLPLPNGDAQRGLDLYLNANLDGVECVTCHTLPTGTGPNGTFGFGGFTELPAGPSGELHHALVSVDGSTNISIKIPQLRNMHEKVGFNTTQLENTAGFGYLHDGSVDSIERFIAEPVFSIGGVQDLADMTAFMLAFPGSDLPLGSPANPLMPPGSLSQDTHAAVGAQVTLDGSGSPATLTQLVALADAGAIGLIAKGRVGADARGYRYDGAGAFQSDRLADTTTLAALEAGAAVGAEVTFTAVAMGMQTRLGLDRDLDGFFDRDELDACADPADPFSDPTNSTCCFADLTTDGSSNGVPDGLVSLSDFSYYLSLWSTADPAADLTVFNACLPGTPDGDVTLSDFSCYLSEWSVGCP